MTQRNDVYKTVTAQLIAAIEAGAGSWAMPWSHGGAPVMRPTSVVGRRYQGINRLILWAKADACGYASGTWATYQQWCANSGQVRKGEAGTHVILWKKADRADGPSTEDRDHANRSRFFARSFCVFNRDQVDLPDGHDVAEVEPITTPIADALALLESIGVEVEYGLHDAYYRPDEDKIYMPERSAFHSDLDLVSTLAHELCNIASVLVSRIERIVERWAAQAATSLISLLSPPPQFICLVASGRES